MLLTSVSAITNWSDLFDWGLS